MYEIVEREAKCWKFYKNSLKKKNYLRVRGDLFL